MNRKHMNISLAALLLLVAGLAGCQSVSTYYRGKTVAPEDVIPLAEKAANRQWSTFDMTITYSYRQTGGNFEIAGQAQLSEHYVMNYNYLDHLDIYLVFIDDHASVIETVKLTQSLTHGPDYPFPFSVRTAIPTRATAFSFAYDGAVQERERSINSDVPFWHLPTEK